MREGAVPEPADGQRDTLLRLLGRPHLARLWELVRARIEELGGVRGSVLLPRASREERAAVAGFLGLRTLPRGALRVSLLRLDAALRASRFAVGLEEAMTLLGGPLRDLPAERQRRAARWSEVWEQARAHPAVGARPELGGWLGELEAGGLLRRLAGGNPGVGRELLATSLAVLAALPRSLPAEAGVRLPVLAAEAAGWSHALEPGRPAATLVLRALARLADRPPPVTAAGRRELWGWAGVVADDLSCDVLVLGLAPPGGGLVGEYLRAFAAAGEPVRLTLRQLSDFRAELPPEARVAVCENPAIVAVAADRLGAACPPLVSIGGFPNSAARGLLAALAAAGAEVRYHGDFDWGGLRIANALLRAVPFVPWRFTTADYRQALQEAEEVLPLRGKPVAAAWDPDLSRTMVQEGAAVEEETVVERLLEDLERERTADRSG